MSEFWPEGIDVDDLRSPRDILDSAKTQWTAESGGVFTLVLQDAKSTNGNNMVLVHAKHQPSNRSAELFTVVHRPREPYPVTIQPKDEDLPNFLKKKYRSFGLADVGSLATPLGGEIHNEWVAESPKEFSAKLMEAFNLVAVKATMWNLAAGTGPGDEDSGQSVRAETTGED